MSSHRAEQSRTVTVRSTSLEAELPFIFFDDLLSHIADLVCTVADNTLAKHNNKTRTMSRRSRCWHGHSSG